MNVSSLSCIPLRKPQIRKLGTIKCDMVETTPIVFHGKLYRFEYFRARKHNESNNTDVTHFRFIDVYTNEIKRQFAYNHHLGCAYTDGKYMYAIGVEGTWGGSDIKIFRSKDLVSWDSYVAISLSNLGAYNTSVCKLNNTYIMLVEVDRPFNFHFRFAQSTDMQNWKIMPEKYCFQKGKYAGSPAIYTLDNDPHYYLFYLDASPGPIYTNCIARSKDLANWTYSPLNPVLMHDDNEDKKIANPFLTEYQRERISTAVNINNSDLEMCEFNGRTIIYYSWGSQRGVEFLSEAAYEGSMKDLLQGYF